MNRVLSTNLVPSGTGIDENRIIVSLESEIPPVDNITLRDVYDMWLLSKSGYSARNYKPYECKVKFDETTITFSVGFFVWPLPITTPYNLFANQGEISEAVRFQRTVEKSITFPLSTSVSLDKYVTNLKYYWETPNIDVSGKVHPVQNISLISDSLVTPEPYFGVTRATLTEEGFRHEVELTLTNVDEEGNNIQLDDVEIIITVQWVDAEGEEQTDELTLELPPCVKQALRMCKAKPNLICQSCDNYEIRVYYDVCKEDEIIEVRKVELEKDGGTWCLPQD